MKGPGVEALVLAGTVLEEQLFAGRSFIHRQGRCMTLTNHG
jgi:hypothetical protein